MQLRDLGEFGLIGRIESILGDAAPAGETTRPPRKGGVLVGIGDDAAAVDLGDGRVLLLSCDGMVEGIHFLKGRCAPDTIGFRAMAAALSDIGAMGGRPRWALVTLAAPADADAVFVEEIIRGARGAAERDGALVVGGDCVSSPRGLAIDVMVAGEGARDHLLLRSAARPGHVLMVTGTVGDSAAGLDVLRDAPSVDTAVASHVTERYLLPTPRIAAGGILAEQNGIGAAIDVSDGLVRDAGHIAERSGVGICLKADLLPISAECRSVAEALGKSALAYAVAGGEDYELLFTVDERMAEDVQAALRDRLDLAATVVGEVTSGRAVTVVSESGQPVDGLPAGWDHFRADA